MEPPDIDEPPLSLHVLSSLEGYDPVIGNVPLSWSDHNCIVFGTSKYALVYELNPLKDVDCPAMLFKTQAISALPKTNYGTEEKQFHEEQDAVRSLTSRDAAYPDFDTYKVYLHCGINEELENQGIQALSFSPSGCAPQDGCVLALLSTNYHLQLFTKSSDGSSISWTKVLDLSEILAGILEKHGGYYPNVNLPYRKPKSLITWEKHNAACITFATWSSIVTSGKGSAAYLISCMKSNYVIVWKLNLPVTSSSGIRILSYTKVSESEIKTITALKSNLDSTRTPAIAVGRVDGTVSCVSFDEEGQAICRSEVWAEKDELMVSCIQWTFCPKDSAITSLVIGKGFLLLHYEMTPDLQVISSSTLKYPHSFPIIGLTPSGSDRWLFASPDGKVMKLWLERSKNTSGQVVRNALKSKILIESEKEPSLFRETTHGIVVSPNLAFIALLKSKPKVSRSVLAKNSSYLEIRTLRTGMKSFEHLCLKGSFDNSPQMDALESVRQYLLHKEFFTNNEDVCLMRACVGQYVTSKTEASPLKWCLARIYESASPDKCILREMEKELVSKQMLKLLRWWVDSESCGSLQDPPVRNIIKWLTGNKHLLQKDDLDFIDFVQHCKKYKRVEAEVCAVTGESLEISEDARSAVTRTSNVSWPRCCLTFVALQGFKCRKCEVSNSRSICTGAVEQELLNSRSIYSGLAMT